MASSLGSVRPVQRMLLDLTAVGVIMPVPANSWRIICYVAAKQISAEMMTGRHEPVMISLAEFSEGIPRCLGTGLSKSSVALAITNAVESGLLRRERRRAEDGGDIPTTYSIAWDCVSELLQP